MRHPHACAQEYYEALHACAAVLPGFASGAYYINKGSSSVGAAFIAGTPLLATPPLLRAYKFVGGGQRRWPHACMHPSIHTLPQLVAPPPPCFCAAFWMRAAST